MLLVALGAWRGLSGWALRALALAGILVALAGPSLQREERDPLTDILLVLLDESASQGLSDRAQQSADALAAVEARVARTEGGLDLSLAKVGDGDGDLGTRLASSLSQAWRNCRATAWPGGSW